MTGIRQLGHTASMIALLPAGTVAPADATPTETLVVPMPPRYFAATATGPVRKADSGVLRVRQWARAHAAFARQVAAARPDWVIFGGTDAVSCLPLRFAHTAGFRCAGVVYGADVCRPRRAGRTRLVRRLGRLDRVIAISEYSADAVTALGYPASRTYVVHPPVACSLLQRSDEPAHARAGGPTIVTVARLVERKGIDDVLAAIGALRATFPDLRYDIVGDGPERGRLERIAEDLAIAERVRFHGALGDDERDRIVRSADVVVMTPRVLPDGDVEGFGIVYLEAGALGKPVIASRSGGIPDAVADGVNGVLIEPSDVRALTAAIGRLLRDPAERARLGDAGRRVARAHHPERCAERLIAALG